MVRDVGELYGSLSERLRHTVAKQVHAPSVVIEDACQFAWSRLVSHANRIEPETALAWLAKTAVHEAVKLARRDQRELSLDARLEQTGELNIAATAPSPQERLEWREQLGLVGRLPERQQRLLWLRAAGLGYDEIAADSGLTVRTVERQLHRGRSQLRLAV